MDLTDCEKGGGNWQNDKTQRERERERAESQEDIKDSQTVREEKKGDEFNKKEGEGEERLGIILDRLGRRRDDKGDTREEED